VGTRHPHLARHAGRQLWLNDVGKATHYHANWVRPRWVSEMRTIQKIGVHTFYRPHRWDEADKVATGS
jgi:spore germination cell wall hydrolase CwlJ-like protein